MVGYIVGLGDRHLENILMDLATAECVHIDLGIAFDQGQLLRVPELIPFRLTPDIIHGMGPAGLEGPFRRCCEATLQVLRGNRDALITLVEVFLHDPLFDWVMTETKANKRQVRGRRGGEEEGLAWSSGGQNRPLAYHEALGTDQLVLTYTLSHSTWRRGTKGSPMMSPLRSPVCASPTQPPSARF